MSNPSDTDIAWLAGLLEGEGHFSCHNKGDGHLRKSIGIQLKMTDEDVVLRAAALLGARAHENNWARDNRDHQTVWRCAVSGAKAERIMRLVRPYMGQRRGAKIDEILAAPVGTYSHQARIKEGT